MDSAVVCTLLLAAIQFGSSDGGAISVSNAGNHLAMLKVVYKKSWDPTQTVEKPLKPNTRDSIPLPYNCYNIEVQVTSPYPRFRKIFNLFSETPVGCSMTLGSAADPHENRVTLAYSESRSLTLLNNGSFYSSVSIGHSGNGGLFFSRRKHILEEGSMITFTVPYHAGKVEANVSYYKDDPTNINPNFDDNLKQELLQTINLLGHDCYTLSGTHQAPSQVKANCEDLYSRNVTLL